MKKLILSGTILFGLMVVNIGMLGQILRDLGVVPATRTFAGIPLSYVFAFIITLVETGLGTVHRIIYDEEAGKLFRWSGFMMVFAFIIACVNGFLYSRVAPSTGVLTVPFINFVVAQSNLFFLWGFVFMMTLFSLGSIGFKALIQSVRNSTWRP